MPGLKGVVVGGGTVGPNWAVLFARGGFEEVVIYDRKQGNVDRCLKDIRDKKLPMLKKFGLLMGKTQEEIMKKISGTTHIREALTGAHFLQECIPESLDLKKQIFKFLDDSLAEVENTQCILASSSSNLTSSQFASDLKCADRVLICHPVNPPFAIPVVEVVPNPKTSEESVALAKKYLLDIGMAPVLLKKEIDGFAVNRLQYALLAEAYRLVEDGVLSPEDVDTCVSKGLGLRWSFMGPFQTIDLNAPKGVNDYCERYSSSILRVVDSQDHARRWKPETWTQMHASMRKEVPMESRSDRVQWRNNRLMEIAQLKNGQDKNDAEAGHPWAPKQPGAKKEA